MSLVLTWSLHLQSASQNSSEGAAGDKGNVFAQLGLLGRSNKAVPQVLTRRALELLTYLAKHHARVAREMLSIRVPIPEEQAQLIDRMPVRTVSGRTPEIHLRWTCVIVPMIACLHQ